jgi:hypothetical protein
MPRQTSPSSDAFDFEPSSFTSNGAVPPETGPDPFDPEALRLAPDQAGGLGVKKALLTVPVRRPAREWFIRVHPDPDYRLQTAVIELKEDGETYLVDRSLWPELGGETTFTSKMLLTTTNRQGTVFLWPVRLPGADGRLDEWSKSALAAAEMALSRWVRVQPDRNLQAYSVVYAEMSDDPVWPDVPFKDLLRVAFKDRYIDSLQHQVLRQLRGEV